MKKILFLLILFPIISQAQNKISYSISVIRGQDTDLRTLNDGNVSTGWFPGWNSGDYPVKALVEFDGDYFVTETRYYDWVGKPKLKVSSVVGTKKKQLFERDLNGYGSWNSVESVTSEKVRYLEIEISDIQGDRPLTELEFYGSKDTKPKPIDPAVTKWSGEAKKLGVNGFHWIPRELNPTANLRMYQMLQWTWTPTGIAVEPTFQADGNYDAYLSDAIKRDQTIILCPNKIPNWMSDQVGDEWSDQRLHRPGSNSTDPLSYREIAEYAWQLAARYGSKTFPSNLLKVNSTPRWNGDIVNQPKSGLNLTKYLEIENEPDRPWKIDLYKYTPEQFAALLSALWDGHEGKLGKYAGIKNADPNLKIVLSGLSSINLDYLNRMKNWFGKNRSDKKFCADVIQVHRYSNFKNPKDKPDIDLTGYGVSPESDNLEYLLKEFNMWVKQNLPKDTEVWFGEFGYDTTPPSTFLSQYAKPYGNHTAEELQGQWILRTYLYCISSRMDKAFMFNLCDENSAPQGYLFGSSGLLTSEVDGFKKKQSWKDVDWLARELNGWKFHGDVSVNGVKVFEFRKFPMVKYFYWSPTSNDSKKEFAIGKKILVATERIQFLKLNTALDWTKVKSTEINTEK